MRRALQVAFVCFGLSAAIQTAVLIGVVAAHCAKPGGNFGTTGQFIDGGAWPAEPDAGVQETMLGSERQPPPGGAS